MATNTPGELARSPRFLATQLSRSSVDSSVSESAREDIYNSVLWSRLRKAWRYAFFFSVVTLVAGVLLVVLGFSEAGLMRPHLLTIRGVGVGLLAITAATWILGSVFAQRWRRQVLRQKAAIDLRERVHLHAMMIDIIRAPVFTPVMVHDPYIRRQLMSLGTRQLPRHEYVFTTVRNTLWSSYILLVLRYN